jgi:hypothetical protein
MGDTLENYTVRQLSAKWGLSTDTIQRWFRREPGVFINPLPPDTRIKPVRARKEGLIIPAHVAERLWRRNCNSPMPVN